MLPDFASVDLGEADRDDNVARPAEVELVRHAARVENGEVVVSLAGGPDDGG